MVNSKDNDQEATMRRISTAELRKWVLVGLGVGTLVSLLSGILLTADWGGLLLNVGAEFGGALATYGLLELFIKRREEEEIKKADLIAQLGSSVKDMAVAAAEELERHGWLQDGSLRGADLFRANLQGADLAMADLQGVCLVLANLREAQLLGTNLRGAILYLVDLQEAWLSEADLQGADLTEADLQGAIFSEDTTLPDGTKWTPDTDMARFTDSTHPEFWRHPSAF
jgi:hypothetical protein